MPTNRTPIHRSRRRLPFDQEMSLRFGERAITQPSAAIPSDAKLGCVTTIGCLRVTFTVGARQHGGTTKRRCRFRATMNMRKPPCTKWACSSTTNVRSC